MADDDSQSATPRLVPVDRPRGASRRIPGAGEVQVPVGLEALLVTAARDDAYKQRVLDDPLTAAETAGIELRPTERATLKAVSRATLRSMIDRVVPNSPKGRPFMDKVAVAVTTLAAGTAAGTLVVSCESTQQDYSGGACPDCFDTTSTTSSSSLGGAGGQGNTGGMGGAGAQGGNAGGANAGGGGGQAGGAGGSGGS